MHFPQTRHTVPRIQHVDGRSDKNPVARRRSERDQKGQTVVGGREIRRRAHVRTQRLGSRIPGTDQFYQGSRHVHNVRRYRR